MLAAAIKRYPVVRLLIDLRITVVCLLLLFVLTFLGTIHQIDNGIYSAQKKYFESFFTLAAGFVPLPGAQLVLWVLFVNLVAATIYRFVYKAKRIGILIIHGGLFVLLFGMFFTQYFAQESFLSLLEGEGGNVTTDYFDWEVAVWGSGRRNAPRDGRGRRRAGGRKHGQLFPLRRGVAPSSATSPTRRRSAAPAAALRGGSTVPASRVWRRRGCRPIRRTTFPACC